MTLTRARGLGRGEDGKDSQNSSLILIDRIPAPLNQRTDRCIEAWSNQKQAKSGKHTFLDDVARDAKKKLSPVIYAKVEDWSKMSQSKMIHGHLQKNKVHPGKRVTSTEEAMKNDKRRNVPAPGVYNNMPKERVL